MHRILVSACLLGHKVRYDGGDKYTADDILDRWRAEQRLISVCPELAAGLSIPRPPAEIQGGGGADVLAGQARVFENTGRDVTEDYSRGAHDALALAQMHDCKFALLVDRSPSCGSSSIYDGAFTGALVAGVGVTAALLRAHGILVFAPGDIQRLAALIDDADNQTGK